MLVNVYAGAVEDVLKSHEVVEKTYISQEPIIDMNFDMNYDARTHFSDISCFKKSSLNGEKEFCGYFLPFFVFTFTLC